MLVCRRSLDGRCHGVVVSSSGRVYKVPSIDLAHLAETTHILRVKNRSGNVHDGIVAVRLHAETVLVEKWHTSVDLFPVSVVVQEVELFLELPVL